MSISVMARSAVLAAALALGVVVHPLAAAAQDSGSALPTVTAVATDATAAEVNAADTGTVEIRRTGPTDLALDVNYTTLYSTADRGKDYVHPAKGTPNGWVSMTHTATIPAGSSSVPLTIVTMQDTLPEEPETVEVLLSHKARSYVRGDPDRGIVTIVDDEAPAAPAGPTGLVATRVSATQVNLAWTDASTNERGFTIEQRLAGSASYAAVADVPLRTVAFSVTSVPAGQAATYRVSAFNGVGRSGFSNEAIAAANPAPATSGVQHVRVAGEPGRTKGWPTNNGMWSWGNEIVVMYDDTQFRQSAFTHAYAFNEPVLAEQARSTDGGLTWTVEKAPIVKPGAPGWQLDGNYGPDLTDLPAPMDFSDPDFVMQVRMANKDYGPSYFYYSDDRARTWKGPYRLPMFGYGAVNARNDYVINGPQEMLLLLSGTPDTNDEGRSRPFAVRTTDGGMTWSFASEVGPSGSIQPSTVRVSPTELVTAIRARDGIHIQASTNNGASWSARSLVPYGNNSTASSPGTLVGLPDGRILIVYGYRIAPFGVRARISADNGQTWSNEVVVRQDGGSFDLGYTRAILRPDGKVVAAYYFNGNPLTERTIEASIIDPAVVFPAPPPTTTTMSTTTTTTSPGGTTTYLSDLTPTSATNGYGSYRKDTNNAGGPIKLRGKTYTKGLGVYPYSDITYPLSGASAQFVADVGIDDLCGGSGTVLFEVYRNGTKAFSSGVLAGSAPAKAIALDLTGTTKLRLVLTDGGDGRACEYADWAGAKIVGNATSTSTTTTTTAASTTTTTSTSTTTTTNTSTTTTTKPATTTTAPTSTTYLSALTPLSATNGLGPYERDRNNGGSAAGDGGPIVVGGVTYDRGLGVYPRSGLTYLLGKQYSRFRAVFGIDDSCGNGGRVHIEVHRVTGTTDFAVVSSGALTGASAPVSIDVDFTNADKLILYVIDEGSNGTCARSDWAAARLLR